MDSISGISLGINALIITYEVRAIVGISAFGFVTGPFVGLGLTAGVTRGSDTGSVIVGVTCRQVDDGFDAGMLNSLVFSYLERTAPDGRLVPELVRAVPTRRNGGISPAAARLRIAYATTSAGKTAHR